MPVYGRLVTCARCQKPILDGLLAAHRFHCRTFVAAQSTRCDCDMIVSKADLRSHRATTDCRSRRLRLALAKKQWEPISAQYASIFGSKVKFERLLGASYGPAWISLLIRLLGTRDYRLRFTELTPNVSFDDNIATVLRVVVRDGLKPAQKGVLLEFRMRYGSKEQPS